jgi:hypothetical protein
VPKAPQARRTENPEVPSPSANQELKAKVSGSTAEAGTSPSKQRPASKALQTQLDGTSSPTPVRSLGPLAESRTESQSEPKGVTEAKLKTDSKAAPEVAPTHNYFTAEDFHEIYDNINAILGVDKVQFLEGWEKWAEDSAHTPGEWMDFFRKSIMPVHRTYDHLGATGQSLVLNWTKDYIKSNPMQPFPGWPAIEGIVPASSSKKRPREEEEEDQVVPESPSQTVAANSGIKRQRIDTIQVTSATIVQKTEAVVEEVSQTIESSPRKEAPDTIDLTTLRDSSSSSDSSEESLTQQAPPARRDEEMEVAEPLSADDDDDDVAEVEEDDEEDYATSTLETQAILAAETQALDFEVPEPEDGFVDTSDSEEESIEQHEQDLINQQLQQEASLNGRDVGGVSEEVGDEDEDATILDVPEPPGGFAGSAPQDDHSDDSDAESHASTTTQATDDESFEDLTSRLMRAGHSRDNIYTAIVATSGNRDLHDVVLDSLRRGKGIPKHVRGVWTAEDDEHLQGSDARMIKRVEEKHGKGGVKGISNRRKFLMGLNAESQSESEG